MSKEYKDWIELRESNKNEFGERLCYCGHTDYCDCSNPNELLFDDSIKRKTIIPNDPKNGWKNLNQNKDEQRQG